MTNFWRSSFIAANGIIFPVRSKISQTFGTQSLLVSFHGMTLIAEVGSFVFVSLQSSFLLYQGIFDLFLGTMSFLKHLFFHHLSIIQVDHSLTMLFLLNKNLCWEQSRDHLVFLMFLYWFSTSSTIVNINIFWYYLIDLWVHVLWRFTCFS